MLWKIYMKGNRRDFFLKEMENYLTQPQRVLANKLSEFQDRAWAPTNSPNIFRKIKYPPILNQSKI